MNHFHLLHWAMRRRGNFQRYEERHGETVLLCVEEGTFGFGVGGERGTATFGDLIFCPPGTLLRRKAHTAHITFLFAEFTFDGDPPFPAGGGKVTVEDMRRLASTFAGLWQLWPHNSPQGWASHLIQDVLYLSASASGALNPNPYRKRGTAALPLATSVEPLMAEAAYLMQAAIEGTAPPNMPIGEIARRLHLGPSQLTRRFAAAWHLTPSEYQAALRLEKACSLLLETDETLDHIARRCGYRDGFYLSRVFRKQMGMPPSHYRKNSRV